MKKHTIIIAAMATSMLFYMLPSCYKNRNDIPELPRVSFRNEVVPILTSGACGCHNTSYNVRAVLFSDQRTNTIFYDAMLARRGQLEAWVNGGTHPGGGQIDFSPSEKNIIKKWIAQGEPYDDGSGCTITGTITWTKDISPIYNTSCKGSTCHGGIAQPLDYNAMVAKQSALNTIVNSNGSSGHPGGALSLSTCTINKFKTWLSQGQPQ